MTVPNPFFFATALAVAFLAGCTGECVCSCVRVCVSERERERVCVSVSVSVCVRAGVCLLLCQTNVATTLPTLH